MKPPRIALLNFGTSVRQIALNSYGNFGNDGGAEMSRRMLFEVGQVMSEVNGHADTAAVLYSVADAIANKLPIEQFPLNLTQIAEPAAPSAAEATKTGGGGLLRRAARRIGEFVLDRFWAGFLLGLIMRGGQ